MKIFFDHKIFTKQCYGGPSRYYTNLVSKLNDLSEIEANDTLKASAKAKLIAGEALTEDEANTIVL